MGAPKQSVVGKLSPQDEALFNAHADEGVNAGPNTSNLSASDRAYFQQEQPDIVPDVAHSAESGLESGVVGIPGIPAALEQMPSAAYHYFTSFLPSSWQPALQHPVQYAYAKALESSGRLPKGMSVADAATQMVEETRQLDESKKSPEEKAGYIDYSSGYPLPTSKGLVEAVKQAKIPYLSNAIGYEPKTPAGHVVQAGTSGIAPAIALGPSSWLSNALMGFTSGASGEATRQFLKDTPYEKYSGPLSFGTSLIAGLPFAGWQTVQQMRSDPSVYNRALNIAGQAQREAYPDAKSAAIDLANKIAEQKAGKYLPGIQPSTAQLTRTPSAIGLEGMAEDIGGKTSSSEITDLNRQRDFADQTHRVAAQTALEAAQKGVPTVDLHSIFDIAPDAQLASSATVKDSVSRVGKQFENAEKDEWTKLSNMGASVNKNAAVSDIESYLKNLGPVTGSAFPADIRDMVTKLKSYPGNEVPFMELQALRSIALTKARQAFMSNEAIHSPTLYGFAKKIEGILNDESSLILPNKDVVEQWNVARNASNTVHDFFGEGKFAGELLDETAPGVPKVSQESALDKMLMGPNGAENLRQVRATPGIDIDKPVSDYMVAKMTKNGTVEKLTPESVSSFMADPKNQAIIREVPGLADRLNAIGSGAADSVMAQAKSKLVENFEKAINQDPARLAKFIKDNKEGLQSVIPAEQHEFLEQLENSSNLLSKYSKGNLTGSKTMNLLAEGNLFTILYGRATGKIPSILSSAAAGLTIGGLSGAAKGALAGAAGITAKFSPEVSNFFSNYMLGDTQHQALKALQKAAHDPEFALMLMNRPSPESIKGFMDAMAGTSKAAARHAVRTGIITNAASSDNQDHAYGGRVGRASGGVVNHASEADRLVALADKAKKSHNNQTKPLLAVPDETITHALAVANESV
jgi:hypothetical protein